MSDELTAEEQARARGDYVEPPPADPPPADPPPADPPPADPPADDPPADDPPPADPPADDPPADDPPPEDEPKAFMIPKTRFDQMSARARDAERKLHELEAAQAAKPPPAKVEPTPQEKELEQLNSNISTLEGELADAISEGRKEDITRLNAEVRKTERELMRKEMEGYVSNASVQTREATVDELAYDRILAQAETALPVLNPDSDKYDKGQEDRVSELVDAYRAQGHPPAKALERSLEMAFGEDWGAEQAPAPPPPAADPPPPRKTDVQKNLDAKEKQPPPMRGGIDSDGAGMGEKIDPMKLPDADFDKLTEAQLSKLRGDDF